MTEPSIRSPLRAKTTSPRGYLLATAAFVILLLGLGYITAAPQQSFGVTAVAGVRTTPMAGAVLAARRSASIAAGPAEAPAVQAGWEGPDAPAEVWQRAPLMGTPTAALWCGAALATLLAHGLLAHARRGGRPAMAMVMAAAAEEPGPSEPPMESGEEPTAEEGADATTDQQGGSPKSNLEVELEEVKAKLAESQKKYLYALAEIETIRRRSRQQVEDAQKFGVEKFALAILEVADNMARGLAWVPKEVADAPGGEGNPNPDLKSLYGGMRSTEKIMMGILERQGIVPYNPLGEAYDPNMARAIAQVPNPDVDPGTVLEVVTLGYTLNDRVLRPADVVVVQDAQ